MDDLFEMMTAIYKYRRLYERVTEGLAREWGLKLADLEILYYVTHFRERNLSKDIVDLGMSKANVSKSVDRLRQKELVMLVEDPEDRRCIHIEPVGNAFLISEKLSELRRRIEQSVMRDINAEERRIFRRVMDQMRENVNEDIARLQRRLEQESIHNKKEDK